MRWLLALLLVLAASFAAAQTSTTATVVEAPSPLPPRVRRVPKRRRVSPPPETASPRDAGAKAVAPPVVAPPPRIPQPVSPAPPIVDRIRRVPVIEIVRQLGDPWALFGLIVVALLAVRLSTLLGRRLLPDGFLPRVNRGVRTGLRLLLVAMTLWLVVTLAPAWMGPALPWILLVVAALAVWSSRDILPDVFAGLVVRVERRIRVGTWVDGDGFSGVVERLGTRGATLRDASNRHVEVPNRLLLGAPVVRAQGIWTAHDACVTIRSTAAASVVRRALEDAVLTSPWIPLEPEVVVRQDGQHPDRWWVRARLLDVRYADRFEGELLERAQAFIDGCAPADDPL